VLIRDSILVAVRFIAPRKLHYFVA